MVHPVTAEPTNGHVPRPLPGGAPFRSNGPSTAPATTAPARRTRPPSEWIYRNLTPWRIEYRVRPDDVEPALTIPPLGETRVRHTDCATWNTTALRRRGQLEIVPAPDDVFERMPSMLLLFGWTGIVLASLVWGIAAGVDVVPLRLVLAGLVLVPGLALLAAGVRELVHARRFGRHLESPHDPESGGAPHDLRGDGHDNVDTWSTQGLSADREAGRHDGVGSQLARGLAQAAILIGSLAVAVLGPAMAIYHASQLRELLPLDVGALFRLEDPFGGANAAARNSPAVWQLLIGHTAQWILVSVASLVPAAMYFQFDRERLAAIQGRWVRQVFRLDPTVRSLGDVQAKYGAHIESSFGVLGPRSGTRQQRGRRSPVVVATILVTIGWIVLATGTSIPDLELVDGQYVWPDGSFPVASFFHPQGTALGFAFLGAYVFALFHVVRAYQRRDLVPKTYNTIVVRILAAYVLTLAAEAMVPGDALDNRAIIAFAFFAGFLPQSALVRLRELASTGITKRQLAVLDERAPLTELEGIDLYDRTRLAEEGINNVHALAHSDIVELMSSTRIPADRLVDWTDQAILFLRVGGDRLDGETVSEDGPQSTRRKLRHLRKLGIRNASDLLQAFEAAVARGEQEAAAAGESDEPAIRARIQREVDQLRSALTTAGMAAGVGGYLPIQGMLDTLADEEWCTQIRNWRTSEFGSCDASSWIIDGTSPHPRRSEELPERVCGSMSALPAFSMPPTSGATTG
jgi:hypothetical protein